MSNSNFTPIAIIGIIVALSGWGTLVYQHITSKPKIKGSILNVMRAQTTFPDGVRRSMFFVYPIPC